MHDVPDGECLFIFTSVEGKTRDLNVFVDSGCNSWLCKKDIVDKETKGTIIDELDDKEEFTEIKVFANETINIKLNTQSISVQKVHIS